MIDLSALSTVSSASTALRALLCSPSPPQSIFLHAGSNPDLCLELVTQILDSEPSPFAPLPNHLQLDVHHTLSPRTVFQTILNRLANWDPPYEFRTIQSWNGQTEIKIKNQKSNLWDYEGIVAKTRTRNKGLLSQRKSSSFDGFCDGLRIISNQLSTQPGPRFIIINRPELLRGSKDFNILTSFTRLAEISGCSIHTIFVSQLPWPKLRPRYGALDPISISIPRLSDHDLIQVLKDEGPPNDEIVISNEHILNRLDDAFEAFVRFIVATFNSQTSADLFELSLLVNRLWPDWITQMDERNLSVTDTAKMILLFKPIIEIEQKSYGSPIWHLPSFLTKPAGLDIGNDPSRNLSDEEEDDETETIVGSPQKRRRTDEMTSPKKSNPDQLLLSPSKTRVQQLIQAPFTTPSKPRHYQIFTPSRTNPGSQPGSIASTRHQFTTHLTPMTPRISTHKSLAIDKGPAMYPRQKTLDILSLSLPVVSRFLILAGFIASFNPARSDLTMFLTSNNDALKKRRARAPAKIKPGHAIRAKIRQRLLGPKMFTIGRLLAIFHAITDQEGLKFEQIDVLQQIGTLIQFKLLVKCGRTGSTGLNPADKALEALKLVISNLISSQAESQILKIAHSLGFNLLLRMFESDD